MTDIHFEKAKVLKEKPDFENLGFGQIFTDYMFVMEYETEKGWYDPKIMPYKPLEFDPAIMVFHYGQAVFEGMKAYKNDKGEICLFRPEKNMERLNKSNDRLCIPQFDEKFILDALSKLLKIEEDWIPTANGTSLYIRPFIIATDPYLGVRPSNTYKFIIILSPVGAYYKEGINPVKIYVESNYVRAVKGGVGQAKCSGNYASSLKAQMEAKKKGYTQVLWLDGIEKKYIEEVGTMNVFFKINGEIITPALNGSILPGITRDSTITALKHLGYNVCERKISIDEVYEASDNGTLEEIFGTGTAAVISPVGELNKDGNIISVNDGKIGKASQELYDFVTNIQYGYSEDRFNWIYKVK